MGVNFLVECNIMNKNGFIPLPVLIAVLAFVVAVGGSIVLTRKQESQAPSTQAPSELTPSISSATSQKNFMHTIVLKTNFGEIHFTTYDGDAPKTSQNFIDLARKGFYNGLTFHRVIKGFMIQGGDPDGNGTGGPGYQFADELNAQTDSYKQGYRKGVVAMANAGPNTNGSQFFIMLEDYPLPYQYTIFGKVIQGQEAVDKIGQVKTDSRDKPLEPVVIESAEVINNGG